MRNLRAWNEDRTPLLLKKQIGEEIEHVRNRLRSMADSGCMWSNRTIAYLRARLNELQEAYSQASK